jgi:glycosyltransferase involved in cell wall biosynthesis
MKILFFGTCAGENTEDYILRNERGAPPMSAQKTCWRFIRGLDEANGKPCNVLSSLAVSRFPIFRKLIPFWLPDWQRGGSAYGQFVPYINLPLLRYVTTAAVGTVRLLLMALRSMGGEKMVVVNYAMYTPHMIPVVAVCKLLGIRCLLIVPDLPEHMSFGKKKSALEKGLRKVNESIAYFLARRFDGYVLFARAMSDRIKVAKKPWLVVEGCVEFENETGGSTAAPTADRNILYAGNLSPVYGIRTLLDAFSSHLRHLKCDLIICGGGGIAEEIQERAREDSRIKYLGVVAPQGMMELQRKATALINPRPGSPELRYAFPSKNLEYMVSGRPVIMYHIPDMPEEYLDHAYIVEEESVQSLARTIEGVLSKSDQELAAKGAAARDYVLREKNYRRQGVRVLDLIRKVCDATQTK